MRHLILYACVCVSVGAEKGLVTQTSKGSQRERISLPCSVPHPLNILNLNIKKCVTFVCLIHII